MPSPDSPQNKDAAWEQLDKTAVEAEEYHDTERVRTEKRENIHREKMARFNVAMAPVDEMIDEIGEHLFEPTFNQRLREEGERELKPKAKKEPKNEFVRRVNEAWRLEKRGGEEDMPELEGVDTDEEGDHPKLGCMVM